MRYFVINGFSIIILLPVTLAGMVGPSVVDTHRRSRFVEAGRAIDHIIEIISETK